MMRSMYSGVSGLRVHQTKMDVIGNNIANVNTLGFKRGQVTFKEVFSQVVRGASAPQEGRGGTNPQQIGLGLMLGSINTIHTKGATLRTDNPTDLMIDGDGFFMVTDDPNYENRYYTRAGNFTLDEEGHLVNEDGFKVLGYKFEDGEWTNEIAPIMISKSEIATPITTENIEIKNNIDSGAELPFKVEYNTSTSQYELVKSNYGDGIYVTDTIIKDSLGNSYKVEFEFMKQIQVDTNGDGTFDVTFSEGDYVNDPIASYPDEPVLAWDPNKWVMNVKSITRMSDGKDVSFQIDNGGVLGTDPIAMTFGADGKLTTSGNLKIVIDDADATSGNIGFGNYDEGSNSYNNEIEINFEEITQFAGASDVKPTAKEGQSMGSLDSFTIDQTGVVIGSFTNGAKKQLGQIALAKFDNPMGLQKIGNNFFENTPNSGEPVVGRPGTTGLGTINPGTLEGSNVDLALEFTEMITTQRGFQANSRTITTTDEMLQELVNLKR